MEILEGKTIVITGSGRGIGKSVALACAYEGANIGLVARTLDELNEVRDEIIKINTNVKVSVQQADITKYNEIEVAFKAF